MGLRLKFNLVLLAVFVCGFSVSGIISWICCNKTRAMRWCETQSS
jgi:hypothetical protein